MNKTTCIIVDDETSGRIVLRELLAEHGEEVIVLAEASNIDEAYSLIQHHAPEVVFLDINMPGGDGFELLKKFENILFKVIFVTSYDKYAINAIKFSALDFLLKPIDINELKESLEKVRRQKTKEINTAMLIKNLISNSIQKDKKIAIHILDKVQFINTSDIVFIEASGSYSDIHCFENNKYTVPKILKEFEEFLEEDTEFVRISRSIIINLKYLKSYSKGDNCILSMTNGIKFEISRRKKIEINSLLEQKFL